MPTPDPIIDQSYLLSVLQELEGAPHGGKGAIVERATAFLGCSRNQLYGRLRELGWNSGRRPRADRGRSKLSHDEARTVATLMAESSRANGKRLLSAETSLQIALQNGMVAAKVSPSTMLRVMRQQGLHPEQVARPTPHTALRSLHPNHVWQFDVSVCVLYYLDKGGLAVMDEKRFYKNKPQNVAKISKQRVLRYLVTDHRSGAFFVKYYLAPGENQETLFGFLMDAFMRREHPQDPMHGVPFIMVWDAGSANQSHLIRNLLDRLQVRHIAHTPGKPRAKGQVEKTHDLIERDFEGRLYLMQIRDIDQLNEQAHAWMRWYNGTRKHSRTRLTRYGLWQTIRSEQLRLCPPRELCEQLLRTKPEPRQIRGGLVVGYAVRGFKPMTYSVEHVPEVRVGETVNVCVNPYRAPNIYVVMQDAEGGEVLHECMPVELDAAGFPVGAPVIGEEFKAARDTDVDRNRKRMAKEAYGAETQAEVDKARQKRVPAFGGRVDPISYLEAQTVAHYMDRPGTALEVSVSSIELPPLGHIEALKRLRELLGRPLSQEENQRVRAAHPDGVPEESLEELAAWLSGASEPAARASSHA